MTKCYKNFLLAILALKLSLLVLAGTNLWWWVDGALIEYRVEAGLRNIDNNSVSLTSVVKLYSQPVDQLI